jgi:hypothetical protein
MRDIDSFLLTKQLNNNIILLLTKMQDIRDPDKSIKEQLLHSESEYTESEFERAIQLSIQYAEEYLEKETKRAEKVESIKRVLLKVRKVAMFDKEIQQIYITIEPYMRSFCEDKNDNICVLDKNTYHTFYDALLKIRLTYEERMLLMSLFSYT